MNKTLWPIRVVFILLCAASGWLVCYTINEWDEHRLLATVFGFGLGLLMVLVDIMLKGFSLRGLSAITFGLMVGSLVAYLIGVSPLLEEGDPQVIFLTRLGLFLVLTYLCTVIALRGKDEFNLVIPYVRFVPHEVDVPLIVVDTSGLIDGRIARICRTGFLPGGLIIPQFVLRELQAVADSDDPQKQGRGRRGLEMLSELRKIPGIDLRIHESEARSSEIEAKLVFLAQSMRAKLLTTDYNLAKLAEFHGVPWLNPNVLAKALEPSLVLGETIEVEIIKIGKEPTQGVGYLPEGSMVVVNGGGSHIGNRVTAEILSVLPSAGGKIIFARLTSASA